MQRVEPKVYLISEPKIRYLSDDGIPALYDYLRDVGAQDWNTDANSGAELLIEVAGRLCYRSWKPGLNPNVTKVREGNGTYLGNILQTKHGSVLEHASVSFIFHNVSRVFTHELVRHRQGIAISQESLRYVRLTDIKMWWPEALLKISELVEHYEREMQASDGESNDIIAEASHTLPVLQHMEFSIKILETLQQRIGKAIDANTSMSFEEKKKITSAMRRFANIGLATSLLWTVNFRALRYILQLRTERAAEEEIRLVFDKVGSIVQRRYPNIFYDFSRNEHGEWKPLHEKV